MAGVPQNFSALSNVLANYDFVDIASGTGYVNFYAGNTVDLKILSNFTYYSKDVQLQGTSTHGAGDELILDTDYDCVINRPLNLKGLGVVNVPVYSGYSSNVVYVIVILRKWNGVTETDIVTNTSSTFSGAALFSMLSVDLDIPLTHFKIGETLRLTIQYHCTNTTGSNFTVGYGQDPKGRTSGFDSTGAVPSTLTFQCPVRLNL